jgi:hypothetical protein
MKRILIVAGLAGMLAACTVEQQAKWQSVVTQIREGVRVSTEVARATLDEVCAQQGAISAASAVAIGFAESRRGPGANPRTDALIRDINTGMAAFQAACTTGSASSTSLANLAVRAWSAYQAVIAAQAAARTV